MNDREAYEFYKDPENRKPVGPGRKRKRPERLVLDAGRTFTCPHMSVTSVISVSCGTCGPLAPVS